MKKSLVLLLALIVCLSFVLVGCNDKNEELQNQIAELSGKIDELNGQVDGLKEEIDDLTQSNESLSSTLDLLPLMVDLSQCDVGYKLPVYPDFEFDYKVEDDFIIHISSIDVELVEKHPIPTEKPFEGNYSNLYSFVFSFSGTTNPIHAGKQIKISIRSLSYPTMAYSYGNSTVSNDGTISFSERIRENNNWFIGSTIIFYDISLVN